MTDEQVQAIAELILVRLRPTVENAIKTSGVRLSKAIQIGYSNGRLVRFLANTAKYRKDRRFGGLCAQGLMPHSKLLKLSKMPAEEFRKAVETAVQDGQIERCCDLDTGLMCYRLPTKQPAPAPVQPPAIDMATLDSPAQDSHEWDFAAALQRAREEREMY
jgi:hypothetical protein